MKSRLLDCCATEERHIAQNLATLLADKFKEWKIERKVVSVVSNNAANILAAVRIDGWKSRGCFAHSINLLVQSGIKAIHPILEKLKTM